MLGGPSACRTNGTGMRGIIASPLAYPHLRAGRWPSDSDDDAHRGQQGASFSSGTAITEAATSPLADARSACRRGNVPRIGMAQGDRRRDERRAGSPPLPRKCAQPRKPFRVAGGKVRRHRKQKRAVHQESVITSSFVAGSDTGVTRSSCPGRMSRDDRARRSQTPPHAQVRGGSHHSEESWRTIAR